MRRISWRRFVALLGGLGPWSVWSITATEAAKAPIEINDPIAGEAAVIAMVGRAA